MEGNAKVMAQPACGLPVGNRAGHPRDRDCFSAALFGNIVNVFQVKTYRRAGGT